MATARAAIGVVRANSTKRLNVGVGSAHAWWGGVDPQGAARGAARWRVPAPRTTLPRAAPAAHRHYRAVSELSAPLDSRNPSSSGRCGCGKRHGPAPRRRCSSSGDGDDAGQHGSGSTGSAAAAPQPVAPDGSGSDQDQPRVATAEEKAAALEATAGLPGAQHGDDFFVMVFTCSVCETRSARRLSKRAYYHGVVLVRCEGCDNLHLIADRLGWFEEGKGDGGVDIEDLIAQQGGDVRKLTADGSPDIQLTPEDVEALTAQGGVRLEKNPFAAAHGATHGSRDPHNSGGSGGQGDQGSV